jgi:hypothetical protein
MSTFLVEEEPLVCSGQLQESLEAAALVAIPPVVTPIERAVQGALGMEHPEALPEQIQTVLAVVGQEEYL